MSEIEKARIVEEVQTHVLQKIAVLIGWNIYCTEMPVKIHGTSAILSSSKHACFQKIHISHSLQSQTYVHVSKNSTSAILSSPKHACFQNIHISHSLQSQTCMFPKKPHQPFSPVPNMHVSKKSTSAILSSPKHACFQKIHISHSPQSQTYRFPKNSTSAIISSPKHTYFQKIMFFLSFLQKTEKLSLGTAAVIDNLLQDGRKILHNVHIHLQYAYKESMEIQF